MATLLELDRHLFWLLYGQDGGLLHAIMLGITTLGGGTGVFALVPLFFYRPGRQLGRAVAIAVVLQALAVVGLKFAFGRLRPWKVYHLALNQPPFDPSFPSGHAAGSFAAAAVCTLWAMRTRPEGHTARRFVPPVAVALASWVALSRVYLGVHYPSDVVVGAALGAAIGALVAHRAFPRRDADHHDTPTERPLPTA